MNIKILSLFKSFLRAFRSRLLLYVSPPLVGVVCLFTSGIDVYAYDATREINQEVIVQMRSFFSHQTQYSDTLSLWQYANEGSAGQSCRIDFNNFEVSLPSEIVTEYTISSRDGTNKYPYSQTSVIDYAFVKLHLIVNGKDYVIDMNRIEKGIPGPGGIIKLDDYRFSGSSNRNVSIYADLQGSGRINILCYIEFCQTRFLNIFKNHYWDDEDYDDLYYAQYGLPIDLVGNIKIYVGDSGVSTPDYDNPTIDSIERGTEQDKLFHDIDQQDATQAGSDMTGLASQLDSLKNTWAILWYPIDFTNRFIQVFVGGTQSAIYEDEYQYVTGYRYNDESGFLEPIMTRTAQPVSAGTGITFPSFELMGMTIWDSYTYDLSSITSQFPVIFDSLYVIVSILEMLWFVSYLRNKYDEVFG